MRVAAALVVAVLSAGCGKTESPKVDAAAERAAALERAKQGPMGDQVKALDAAKALEADVKRKAQD